MDSCLKRYFDSLADSSSRVDRCKFLERFFEWCGVSPGEAVSIQKGDPLNYRFVDSAYEFIDLRDLRVSTKQTYFSVVSGFFLCNRVPLPKEKHVFRSDKTPVIGELTFEEFRQILLACRPDKRCIFLMMFQSGSGLNEFDYINRTYADLLFEKAKRGDDVVCLNMRGRKQNRNVLPYYTFLGGDALDCLRQYFSSKGWVRDSVLFRTDFGEPVSKASLQRYFTDVAKKCGFLKQITPKCGVCGGETVKKKRRLKEFDGRQIHGYLCTECGKWVACRNLSLDSRKISGFRYRIHTHEIRDRFRTEFHRAAHYCGADVLLAEFMMGHEVDALGYNKIMNDRKYAKSEYLKIVPYLNVLSEDPRKIDKTEVQDKLDQSRQREELLSEEVSKMKKRLKDIEEAMRKVDWETP